MAFLAGSAWLESGKETPQLLLYIFEGLYRSISYIDIEAFKLINNLKKIKSENVFLSHCYGSSIANLMVVGSGQPQGSTSSHAA